MSVFADDRRNNMRYVDAVGSTALTILSLVLVAGVLNL